MQDHSEKVSASDIIVGDTITVNDQEVKVKGAARTPDGIELLTVAGVAVVPFDAQIARKLPTDWML